MKNNKIVITIKDGTVSTNYDKPMDAGDALIALATASLAVMNTLVSQVPEDEKEACTNAMYDAYNIVASNVLTQFAPHLELRPNLTTQAILEAENKIIDEHYKKAQKAKKKGKVVEFPYAD